jgi:hypothetical protein
VSNSQQTTHHNTSLTATNINLNTTQDTKIKGANLQATNQLNLNTKNLEVSSVQNKHKAKTRSQGASLGVVGILAREDVKVLTVYVDLSVICVGCVDCVICVICIGLEV